MTGTITASSKRHRRFMAMGLAVSIVVPRTMHPHRSETAMPVIKVAFIRTAAAKAQGSL
jgi:hypothetical protein